MSTVVACLILLALCGPLCAALAGPTPTSTGDRLEDVLTEGAWVSDVRYGRIAIENRTLTFCVGGRVHQRIFDDTGHHESWGAWTLERTDDGHLLTLSGQLRQRGRFGITCSEDERAIYLHLGSGEKERFRAVRGSTPSPCKAPDKT